MKLFLLAIVLLSLPLAASAETASTYQRVLDSGVIRCGYVNWKPYYYKDPNTNVPAGINFDIMNEIAKTLDLKVEWTEEIGWGTIGEGFKTGRYDAVCTSMWPDAGKYKNLSLSVPFFYSAPTAYVRVDDKRFDGHAERINKPDTKIAVIDGALTYNLAKQAFPQAQLVALPQMVDNAEYLLTVETKKADIAIMDPDEIKTYMQSNPGKLRPVSNVAPARVLPHVMAFPANEPQFTAMMNAALQVLIDNGFMTEMRKKYETGYLLPRTGYIQ